MTQEREYASFLVRNIPKDLYQRFKLHCVQEERSINKEMLRLIAEAMSEEPINGKEKT